MMIVRVFLNASDAPVARELSRQLCGVLERWGSCDVLKLEPDYKEPGQYVEYVNVSVDRRGDPIVLIRAVARDLASGDWTFHIDNPDEAWAVWDARTGGSPVVHAMTWSCIELLPVDGAAGSIAVGGTSEVQPPQ